MSQCVVQKCNSFSRRVNAGVFPACALACPAQARTRELVEAERTATSLVKGLRSDLATEKEQHDQQVCDAAEPVLHAQH